MTQVPIIRTTPEVQRQCEQAVAQRRIQDCVARLQRIAIAPDIIVTRLRREARSIERAAARLRRSEPDRPVVVVLPGCGCR